MPRKSTTTTDGTSKPRRLRKPKLAKVDTATLSIELSEPELGELTTDTVDTEAQLDIVVVKPVEEGTSYAVVEDGPVTEDIPVVVTSTQSAVLPPSPTEVEIEPDIEPAETQVEAPEPITEAMPVVEVPSTVIPVPVSVPSTPANSTPNATAPTGRKPMSDAQKQALRTSLQEYYKHNPHPMKGKSLSQTTKDNIAAARRAQQPTGKNPVTGRPTYK